jgi:hypothetical protein
MIAASAGDYIAMFQLNLCFEKGLVVGNQLIQFWKRAIIPVMR